MYYLHQAQIIVYAGFASFCCTPYMIDMHVMTLEYAPTRYTYVYTLYMDYMKWITPRTARSNYRLGFGIGSSS